MYKVNDLIMYGSDGVFRVEEICSLNISGVDNDKLYYVLIPLYREGKTYAPIDTNVFMRPIITYEAAQQLIDTIPSVKTNVYDGTFKVLKDQYKASIQTHDCADLIQLIKSISTKNDIVVSQGKKPGQIDEHYMKIAEDLLYSEFSVVLDIPKESVKSYIEARVKELENSN